MFGYQRVFVGGVKKETSRMSADNNLPIARAQYSSGFLATDASRRNPVLNGVVILLRKAELPFCQAGKMGD